MTERNFVVWDGKTGDKRPESNRDTTAMGEKIQTLTQPGPASLRVGQPSPPDPEVVEKPARRKFTAEYKLKIVREAEACGPGELGALLRREGLYFSNLTCWRRQVAEGELAALVPKKRGRKEQPVNPFSSRLLEIERDNERLRGRLRQAEQIIEVQKKSPSFWVGFPWGITTQAGGTDSGRGRNRRNCRRGGTCLQGPWSTQVVPVPPSASCSQSCGPTPQILPCPHGFGTRERLVRTPLRAVCRPGSGRDLCHPS